MPSQILNRTCLLVKAYKFVGRTTLRVLCTGLWAARNMVRFLFPLEEDARTAFSHQVLIRKAFSMSRNGPVVSGWYDTMNYGQCHVKNYGPSARAYSVLKPMTHCPVQSLQQCRCGRQFLPQDNLRKTIPEDGGGAINCCRCSP